MTEGRDGPRPWRRRPSQNSSSWPAEPQVRHHFYGDRLGIGCYWRFGSEEDFRRAGRARRWHRAPCAHLRDAAECETHAEAEFWRRWRLHAEFATRAPAVARRAFQAASLPRGLHPCEPGRPCPAAHRRYRVIGAAAWVGRETVIDLGFWHGSPSAWWSPDSACAAAALAIIRSWPERREHIMRFGRGGIPSGSTTFHVPAAVAGFSYGIVKT
jgi:hypothetical protein